MHLIDGHGQVSHFVSCLRYRYGCERTSEAHDVVDDTRMGLSGHDYAVTMGWQEEIVDLQRFLEAYYLGKEASLRRAEQALHPEFTFAGPNGETADRDATLEMLRHGHGHTAELRIVTSNHQLLCATAELIVASYTERHELSQGDNERLCTVVFVVDEQAPNGVRWLRIHESWISQSPDEGQRAET